MKKAEAEEIIRKVADFLEGDWHINPSDSSWQISIEDIEGKMIYFSGWDEYNCKSGKFEISGGFPYSPYQRDSVTIGVSFSKEPIKIASDIEKRFMPKYNEIRTKLLARIEEHNKWKKHNEEVLSQFLALLGEGPRRDRNGEVDWEQTSIRPYYPHTKEISLYSRDKDIIDLYLTDLPVELASEVVQLLLARKKPEPVPLRALDEWTAMTLIIKAVKAKFDVDISREHDRGAKNYVTSRWSHYQLHVNGKTYDILDSVPGVNNLGIEFEEAETKKVGMG